jgi:hypothetical protein
MMIVILNGGAEDEKCAKTESPSPAFDRPRGQFDSSLYPGKRAENREVEASRDMILIESIT